MKSAFVFTIPFLFLSVQSFCQNIEDGWHEGYSYDYQINLDDSSFMTDTIPYYLNVKDYEIIGFATKIFERDNIKNLEKEPELVFWRSRKNSNKLGILWNGSKVEN